MSNMTAIGNTEIKITMACQNWLDRIMHQRSKMQKFQVEKLGSAVGRNYTFYFILV